MKKIFFLFHSFAVLFHARAQNIGIGTASPQQKLHVEGASFLNGNVGIQVNNSIFPLSFAPVLGDKISLWSNATESYGFGIQSSQLQIHTDISAADIVFGYGSSADMTETMRVKGNGNVGIGHSNPYASLTFSNTTGEKISFYGNTSSNYGIGLQNGLLQIHTDGSNADIAIGYVTDGTLTENMRIKGNGNVGIGTNNPTEKLVVNGRVRIRTGTDGEAGIWLNNAANSNIAGFIGLENDNYIGLYGVGAGWKFAMNTQTGSLKINGTEGLAGQVLTSNATAAPAWNFPVKIYQWLIAPNSITSTTENTFFSQTVSSAINSYYIISVQISLAGSALSSGDGTAYLYIDGNKYAQLALKVDGNLSYKTVISLPNIIYDGGTGTHTLEVRAHIHSGSGNMFIDGVIGGAFRSYVSVLQIAR